MKCATRSLRHMWRWGCPPLSACGKWRFKLSSHFLNGSLILNWKKEDPKKWKIWLDLREQNSEIILLAETLSTSEKSFYQREMTSSDARLRFIVIAVNIETVARGAGRWEEALNSFHKPRRGHCSAHSGLTSVPRWPAGICRRLWLARKLASSSLTFDVRCRCMQFQVRSVRNHLIRVLDFIWLHHGWQKWCSWMVFSSLGSNPASESC